MDKEKYFSSVYDMDTVYNVCNQILREVISLSNVSMAHVIMEPENVSLLHKHNKMTEVYYILNGKGVLYLGDKAYQVNDDNCIIIPKQIPHKLRNTENVNLEHLVFAIPPFNPSDVILLEDFLKEPAIEELNKNYNSITALDGATIYELLSGEDYIKEIGLAYGSLPKKRKAIKHKHEKSEEVYYILSGEGRVKVSKSYKDIKKGDVIYIPKNFAHALENTSDDKELKLLCISDPRYENKDFIIV